MDKEIRLALLNKERAELFLSNLERLFADKTINETTYKMLKSEYNANLENARQRVEQLKQELNKRLAVKSRELDIYRQELANLDARFKVGQLSADEFIKLSKKPDKKVNYLEEQISHLSSLISSQHSSEIAEQETSGIGSIFKSGTRTAVRPDMMTAPLEQPPVPAPPPVTEPPAVVEPSSNIYKPVAVSDLMILPDRVMQGSTVGIIATIHNHGTDVVHHRTEFRINEKVESISEITLYPGQRSEMTFMAVAGPPGEYQVSVDSATGIFRVLPPL